MTKMLNKKSHFKYIPEIISFLLYIIGNLVLSYYHEPWFDEAVAWDIARDTSIKDILFYVPHYEGHPQLWHLILAPFAKLGSPYELTLVLINLFFCGLSVALILRFAPIYRPIKLLLPFTFFFFYQYGIISRPYSIMMLAFVLSALAFPKKNDRPGRFVLSLILLCSSSAYGILFAGGITLVWLFEIWHFENVIAFIKRFVKDKRFYWMFVLLVYALFLAYSIAPAQDNFAIKYVCDAPQANNLFIRSLYMFLVVWGDVTCTNVLNEPSLMGSVVFSPIVLISGCFFGLIILSFILYYGYYKKTILLFTVPAILFCAFSSSVYIYNHHIGVALLFGLFWYWCSALKESSPKAAWETKVWDYISKNISVPFQKLIKVFPKILIAYAMIISLYWTAASCTLEIKEVYSCGPSEAKFIKENHLEKYNIWGDWFATKNKDGEIEDLNVNYGYFAYTILPYFDHNIFSNYEYGTDGNFILHVVPDEETQSTVVERWRSLEKPDILAGYLDMDSIFTDEEFSYSDYTLVFMEKRGKIWKNMQQLRKTTIYMKNELAKELGFERIQDTDIVGW